MEGVRWGWLYQNGDGRYTLPDALGSTAVFAQDGTVEASRFYPFGEEAQTTSAEYQWTNQIRDGNALDHFAFRTYSSNLARWLSADPAGLAAVNPAEPSSWNRYAYVENRPLSAADPLGLFCRPGGACIAMDAATGGLDGLGDLGSGWDELAILTRAFTPTLGIFAIDPEFPASDNSMLYLYFGNQDLLKIMPYLDSLIQRGDTVDIFPGPDLGRGSDVSLGSPQPATAPHSKYDTCDSVYERRVQTAATQFTDGVVTLGALWSIPGDLVVGACLASGNPLCGEAAEAVLLPPLGASALIAPRHEFF